MRTRDNVVQRPKALRDNGMNVVFSYSHKGVRTIEYYAVSYGVGRKARQGSGTMLRSPRVGVAGLRDGLTFMPRFVRKVPHVLQSNIQTLCGIGGGGGATKGCPGTMRTYPPLTGYARDQGIWLFP